MKSFVISILLFICSNFIFPESTLFGPTGLIEMPTAKAIEYKKVHSAYDYQFINEDGNDSQSFYKVNIGTYDNLEIGFVGGTVPTEGVFINTKYFIMSDSEAYPTSLAIGFQNMGSQENSSVYLVASKVFEQGLEGHFGFKSIFKKKIDTSAMIGLEYFVSDQFSFLADYTGIDNKYTVNLGARFYINEVVAFRLAVTDLNKVRENEETLISTGLSFSQFF